eukprot:TRINITY_DN12424_c0_g1_i2.p2 TRINITY_DN12424_c0_g1~~TRINITY_DN12424_c0_g1_i2.p2  ORF type:complete len:100 (+),score=15.93 TRINITY_DN12424_c0_g1_i2:342-641(+)
METLILGLVPDSIYKKLTKGLRIERLIESSGTFIVLYFPFLSRINEESSHNFNRVRVIKGKFPKKIIRQFVPDTFEFAPVIHEPIIIYFRVSSQGSFEI